MSSPTGNGTSLLPHHRAGAVMVPPAAIALWTADEVAEVLYPYALPEGEAKVLLNRLWEFVGDAKNPTPLGGDGTNGTVETPDGRMDPSNDDKAWAWWSKLTDKQRSGISRAIEKEQL